MLQLFVLKSSNELKPKLKKVMAPESLKELLSVSFQVPKEHSS